MSFSFRDFRTGRGRLSRSDVDPAAPVLSVRYACRCNHSPSKEALLRDYSFSRGGDDLSHLLIGVHLSDVSEKLKFQGARVTFSSKMLLSPSRPRVRRRSGAAAAAEEFGSDGKHQNVTKRLLF